MDEKRSSHKWPLSARGRQRCLALAAALEKYQPDIFIASEERKAQETANIISLHHGKAYETVENLHEQRREYENIVSVHEFKEKIADLFRYPDQIKFGSETANAARDRFTAAVKMTVAQYPQKTLAIVSHGVVMSLFIASHANMDPHEVWYQMGLPAYAAFSLPDYELIEYNSTLL